MKKSMIVMALSVFVACSPAFAADSQSSTRVVIELAGNPSTGYSWTYTLEPEGIVKEVFAEYRSDASQHRVGSGGTFVFSFEGIAPGQSTLTFRYARPWESVVPTVITYNITVDTKRRIQIQKRVP
jgi:predicted secreted protein